MTRLSNPVAKKFKAEADSIFSSVLQLEKDADQYWVSGKWDELTLKVNKMGLMITRHLHKVRWSA